MTQRFLFIVQINEAIESHFPPIFCNNYSISIFRFYISFIYNIAFSPKLLYLQSSKELIFAFNAQNRIVYRSSLSVTLFFHFNWLFYVFLNLYRTQLEKFFFLFYFLKEITLENLSTSCFLTRCIQFSWYKDLSHLIDFNEAIQDIIHSYSTITVSKIK